MTHMRAYAYSSQNFDLHNDMENAGPDFESVPGELFFDPVFVKKPSPNDLKM